MKKESKIQPKIVVYKIEKDIPIPHANGNDSEKYPFNDMKVGDSFTVPYITKSTGSNIMTHASRFIKAKKLDWKFTARSQGKIVRIWRIK